MSMSQHNEFAAAAHLAEGQFLRNKKLVIVSHVTYRNPKTNII
jgi:hypothetical protein